MIKIQEELTDGTRIFGWKSEPPLTPFAPDYKYYISEKKIFSEDECKEWNAYLLEQELILLDGLGDNYIRRPGGMPVQINLLKFDFHLIPKLKTELLNGIKSILSVSGNIDWQGTLYANSWFNVLQQGQSLNAHIHSYHKNTFYGFHVNINTIDTFTSYYHPIKFQEESIHVPNKIGCLCLFPHFIPHGVSQNNHETPRITVAGDIFPATWLDEKPEAPENENLVEKGVFEDFLRIGICGD